MQMVEFPLALRTHLAALALDHETGKLDDATYTEAKRSAIAETEVYMRSTGRLAGDGWNTTRSPGFRHYAQGHSACWWKEPEGYQTPPSWKDDVNARMRIIPPNPNPEGTL